MFSLAEFAYLITFATALLGQICKMLLRAKELSSFMQKKMSFQRVKYTQHSPLGSNKLFAVIWYAADF